MKKYLLTVLLTLTLGQQGLATSPSKTDKRLFGVRRKEIVVGALAIVGVGGTVWVIKKRFELSSSSDDGRASGDASSVSGSSSPCNRYPLNSSSLGRENSTKPLGAVRPDPRRPQDEDILGDDKMNSGFSSQSQCQACQELISEFKESIAGKVKEMSEEGPFGYYEKQSNFINDSAKEIEKIAREKGFVEAEARVKKLKKDVDRNYAFLVRHNQKLAERKATEEIIEQMTKAAAEAKKQEDERHADLRAKRQQGE